MPLPEDFVTDMNALWPEDEIVERLLDEDRVEEGDNFLLVIEDWLIGKSRWDPNPEWVIDRIGKGLGGEVVREAGRILKIRELRHRINQIIRQQ